MTSMLDLTLPSPHVICNDLHIQEGTITGAAGVSVVCRAPITRAGAGNTEFKKLWKVVEERINHYGNYKVPRSVVEPGNVNYYFFLHINSFLREKCVQNRFIITSSITIMFSEFFIK